MLNIDIEVAETLVSIGEELEGSSLSERFVSGYVEVLSSMFVACERAGSSGIAEEIILLCHRLAQPYPGLLRVVKALADGHNYSL